MVNANTTNPKKENPKTNRGTSYVRTLFSESVCRFPTKPTRKPELRMPSLPLLRPNPSTSFTRRHVEVVSRETGRALDVLTLVGRLNTVGPVAQTQKHKSVTTQCPTPGKTLSLLEPTPRETSTPLGTKRRPSRRSSTLLFGE